MCNFACAKKIGVTKMKYAIIAAGEGSRLREEGINTPKPLVEINGEKLLDRLIRIFITNGAEEIIVITNELYAETIRHLEDLKQSGLPLRYVVKNTKSSMHSFYEIAQLLQDDRFILTTTDTIFDEHLFTNFVKEFSHTTADGIMAVTSYCDDEKPLYVTTNNDVKDALPVITGFHDSKDIIDGTDNIYISAGIYGLTPHTLNTLRKCIDRGICRMRNFQRELVAEGLNLLAFPLGTVMDIDHSNDIQKAEEFLLSQRIVGIYRAERFSPNSVEKDRTILQATMQKLQSMGYSVCTTTEEELLATHVLPQAKSYLSMARSEEVLKMLQDKPCINSSDSVRYCNHRRYISVNATQPPLWIKRADQCSEQKGDVAFCGTDSDIRKTVATYNSRGIGSYVLQPHYEGECIKFYGVKGTTFFFPSGQERLKDVATKMAKDAGLMVYGGDAIIGANGEINIIDLNDWPSFAPCVEEAATAIASVI